jgi:hypothetical protein
MSSAAVALPAPGASCDVPRCSTCILPADYPRLDFDEAGRCSLCRAHQPIAYRGLEALRRDVGALAARRPRRRYDCIVGTSGGRDSSYLLHLARRVLGLNVVALFVDHGHVPEESLDNVRRMTDALDVPLVVHRHDRLERCFPVHLRAWLRRPRPHTLATLCVGCKGSIITATHQRTRALGVPVQLWGGTPFEMATYKMDLLRAPWVPDRRLAYVTGYLGQLAANPALAANPRCAAEQAREFAVFYGFWTDARVRLEGIHHVAPYVDYVHWREEEITRVLETGYQWRRLKGLASSWRGDCHVAPVRAYLYRAMLGYDDKVAHLSALVRDGQITRNEALERERAEGVPEEVLEACCAHLGLRAQDLREAAARYRAGLS